METRKKVIVGQFNEGLIGLIKSVSLNFVNNFIQSKVPINAIQAYQNTNQFLAVLALAELHISPKLILLIIMFL